MRTKPFRGRLSRFCASDGFNIGTSTVRPQRYASKALANAEYPGDSTGRGVSQVAMNETFSLVSDHFSPARLINSYLLHTADPAI